MLGINTEDLHIFSDIVDSPSYGKLLMLFDELESSKSTETIESEDLNQFKQVNDIYGHHVGDQLLKKFADIATNQTREERDFIFRFGGDEFLIILAESNEDGALKIAKRIEGVFKELTDQSLSYGAVSLPINT